MEDEIRRLISDLHEKDHSQRYRTEETLLNEFGREAVPYLIEALSTGSTPVRMAIARLLGTLADHRAVIPLIAIVQNEDLATSPGGLWSSVASNSIQSLGEIGDDRAIDVLIEALNHRNFRYLSAIALGRIGDPRAVQPLLAILHQDKDPSVATVLGNFGDARAVEPMIAELEILRQPMTAAEISKIWGSQRWRDIYFYYVAHGLGKLADPQALPILEWVRDHEQEPVLKGRSIGYKAAHAIDRIHAHMESSTQNERENQ